MNGIFYIPYLFLHTVNRCTRHLGNDQNSYLKHSSICKAKDLESSLHSSNCHRGPFSTSNSIYLRNSVVRHFFCVLALSFVVAMVVVVVVCSDLSFWGQHCRLKQTFLRNILSPSSELHWIQLKADVIRL